jgi:hypothetical protein
MRTDQSRIRQKAEHAKKLRCKNLIAVVRMRRYMWT